MVFSDLFFIFVFLPVVMLFYLLAAGIDSLVSNETMRFNHLKNLVLVVSSLVFYAWGEPVYVLLMLASVVVNYILGLIINHAQSTRKCFLVIGLMCNIAILGTFKYASFFVNALNQLGLDLVDPKISLPIGISFYIFQSISYLVDVYRRETPVQKYIGNLLLYISMFPQLIAGPIVRYGTVADEIQNRNVTLDDFSEGIWRFLIGLGKKVIIANQLSEISGSLLDGNLSALSPLAALTGIVAFTFQIYFDFSGYSDMAIGLGRCLGFHFNENFNHPYCCKSISEFWRRWHMSLGSFFRDYVYIPMGGNRHHQVVNIFVVWFLTGMWHGASWNFIIWGLYFGLIVMLEKYTLLRINRFIPSPLLHIYSIILIVIGWGIFYFDDYDRMLCFFGQLLDVNNINLTDFTVSNAIFSNLWVWVLALIFCMPVREWMCIIGQKVLGLSFSRFVFMTSRLVVSLVIIILSVSLLVGATNNAFIYTRF